METTKMCISCNKTKPLNNFTFRTDSNRYRNQCKTCKNKYSKNHYVENKEIKLKFSKINYNENKERKRLWGIGYRKENSEHIIFRHKKYYDENKEKIKKYANSERGILSRRNTKNKRRDIINKGSVTTDDIVKLYRKQKECYWCRVKLNKKYTHMDHYIPLSRGGKHDIDNIVLSCAKCNLTKSAKDPITFANKIGRLL